MPLQPERPAEQPHNEPDLGKFPAQRRKKKYIKEPLGKSSSPAIQMAEKSPASADKTPNPVTQPTPPAPNTNGSSISHHGFQPMQKAMKDFSRNLNLQERSDSEVVYAKGVGPPKRTGGTIWPQRDKRLLANRGMKALMSDARNADKNISAEEIIRYLDQNVSYQDLCEILESRDLVFDRGSLARTLLSATSANRNTTIQRETDIVKPVSEVTNHVEVMDNVNNHMGSVDSVDNHVEVVNNVNNHTEVVNSANNHNEVINQNEIGMLRINCLPSLPKYEI